MDVIAKRFLTHYPKVYDYYKSLSEIVAEKCRQKLRTNGIRAIVTARAKDPDRLKLKLEQREVQYQCEADVTNDIADLAGVRVALYYPGDMTTVANLLSEDVELVRRKTFPAEGQAPPAKRRFSGYRAVHLIIKLKCDEEVDARYSSSNCEIQIASLFMHAWAEVDHDLVYKPLQGEPSDEERAILDELNGLSLTAEIALEQLQKRTVERRERENARFANQFAMASYLHDYLASRYPGKEIRLNLLDALYAYLSAVGQDTPVQLKALLDGISFDLDFSASSQITDWLVYGSLSAYETLSRARATVWTWTPFYSDGEVREENWKATKRDFIILWIALEIIARSLTGLKPINTSDWEHARKSLASQADSVFFQQQTEFHEAYEEFRRIFHSLVAADQATMLSSVPQLRSVITEILGFGKMQAPDQSEVQDLLDITTNS